MLQYELKKILQNKIVLILWVISMALGWMVVRVDVDPSQTYADLFGKLYSMLVFMGFITFGTVSSLYSKEKNTNVEQVVKGTSKGHLIPIYKLVGAGLVTTFFNETIFFAMITKAGAWKPIEMSIKQLWYFNDTTWDFSVSQMILLTGISIAVGSFALTSIGLLLNGLTGSSALAFLVGGGIMAVPFTLGSALVPISFYTPTWMMLSSNLVKHNIDTTQIFMVLLVWGILVLGSFGLCFKAFNKKG